MIVVSGCGKPPPAVPADLEAVEAAAEHSFDQALAGELANAHDSSLTLGTAWDSFRPRAVQDGAPASALATIDEAIAALPAAVIPLARPAAAARAINRVSGPMSQLYAVYHPVVPVAVLDLDYLGREVLLDAADGDFAQAITHLDTIEATWSALSARVVASGGAAAADDLARSLEQARAATSQRDGALLTSAAQGELDAVDAVETVFASKLDSGD